VEENGSEHLVGVGDLAIAVVAGLAVAAVNLIRAEILDAVECDQVTTLEENILFEDLGSLELSEDICEGGADGLGGNLVEDGAHVGVAGDGLKAKDRAEIVIEGSPTESEEGGILEAEDGKASHQGVGQGEDR
jgi:hypothetical protein